MYDLRDLFFDILEQEPDPPELTLTYRRFYELLEEKIPDARELEKLDTAWGACNTEHLYHGFDMGLHAAIRLIFENPTGSHRH